MRTSNLGFRLSGLLTLALALGVMLSACGGTETITSAGSTAVAGGGTVIAGGANGAGTAIAGGASGAGTAIAGGASGAGTAIAGGASGAGTAIAGGGTAIAGGASGAGTAVSGALTPGATPTAAGALTPAAGNGLPVAQGATKITLSDSDRNLIQGQFQPLATIVNQPTYDFYKLTGQANNSAVASFYTNEMTRLGWANRSNDLGAIANFANLNFAGVKPLVFSKGNQLAVVGVSNPLTAENISSAGLGSQYKPGDIAIMLATGTLKISF